MPDRQTIADVELIEAARAVASEFAHGHPLIARLRDAIQAVDRLEALSGGEAVPIEPRTIRNLLAECDALDEGREHDAEQAFDGDRPDLWEPPEVGVSTVILREILRVYLAAPRPMPGREEVVAHLRRMTELFSLGPRIRPWARDEFDRERNAIISLFSASLGGREDTAARVTDSGRGALPTPPEGAR